MADSRIQISHKLNIPTGPFYLWLATKNVNHFLTFLADQELILYFQAKLNIDKFGLYVDNPQSVN